MNSEFEQLICKFYDLSCEEKKAEIFNEIKKMNDLLKNFSSLNNDPIKNKFIGYDDSNSDSEDQNLTKIYYDLMLLNGHLLFHLKDINSLDK